MGVRPLLPRPRAVGASDETGAAAMNRHTLAAAKREALRFLDAVKHFELVIKEECHNDPQKDPGTWMPYCSAASGTVRRASMDLTRALAEMRKP